MCIFCNLAGTSSGGLGCSDLPNPGDPNAGDHTTAQTGGADVGVGAPAAFSLAQIVQQLRTQWGGSFEGSTLAWPGTGPIAYFIGGTPYPSGSGEIAYKTTMTALMTSRATLAFELWDDLIARDLTPASSAAFAQIQFEYASQTYDSDGMLSPNGGTYSGAWFNGTGINGYGTTNYNVSRSEIWLNRNWTSHNADNDMFFGGYGFQTYMHEIGHSLGLSHPGTYDAGNGGSITYANNAEYSLDNRQYTIMSYFGGYAPDFGWQQDGTSANWLYSSTPMLHDIAAVQAIYGADMSTRAANTTYGFNSNAGRDVFNFNLNTSPIITIWDAGGNDTLDLSGYATNQRIDLHAGAYSDVGGMLSNFAIAYNVTIENAIGGAGADTIVGNDVGNTLRGGAGNDSIDGSGGFDSAIFSGVRAAYTITVLGGSTVRVTGPDGTDTVTNVEQLIFNDQVFTVTVIAPPPPLQPKPTLHDANIDGRADFFWQNSDGTPAVWLMNGTNLALAGPALANPGPSWHAKDAADFNGDGKADILWQNDSGTPAVWLMNGTSVSSYGPGLPNPGPAWHEIAAADFNGDNRADILFQNDNGAAAVWLMNGTDVSSFGPGLPNPGPAWHAKDAADFNGDGKADILWQRDDGTPAVWLMDGANLVSFGAPIVNPGAAWHEKAAADFNGDGKADILFQNDNGAAAVWLMDGTTILSMGSALPNPGSAWHVKEAADFNGDGRADIAWQNDSGAAAVWLMNGTSVDTFGGALPNPGAAWHIV